MTWAWATMLHEYCLDWIQHHLAVSGRIKNWWLDIYYAREKPGATSLHIFYPIYDSRQLKGPIWNIEHAGKTETLEDLKSQNIQTMTAYNECPYYIFTDWYLLLNHTMLVDVAVHSVYELLHSVNGNTDIHQTAATSVTVTIKPP